MTQETLDQKFREWLTYYLQTQNNITFSGIAKAAYEFALKDQEEKDTCFNCKWFNEKPTTMFTTDQCDNKENCKRLYTYPDLWEPRK